MIDHIGIDVKDFAKSKAFYEKALAPLGYEKIKEFDFEGGIAGFGIGGKPDFWIGKGGNRQEIHVAFRATSRKQVDDFYAAAIAAGGTDNGKPGLRPEYHANYYGGFVIDFDGNNVEAAFHG